MEKGKVVSGRDLSPRPHQPMLSRAKYLNETSCPKPTARSSTTQSISSSSGCLDLQYGRLSTSPAPVLVAAELIRLFGSVGLLVLFRNLAKRFEIIQLEIESGVS